MGLELDVNGMISLAGIVISISSIIIAWAKFGRMLENRITKLEMNQVDPARLTALETKIEPLWDAITNEIPRLIMSPHTSELDRLIKKATGPNSILTLEENNRLLQLLDQEYALASESGDTARAISISLYRATIKASARERT